MNFLMLTPKSDIFLSLERYLEYAHGLELEQLRVNPISNQTSYVFEFNQIFDQVIKKTNNVRNTIVFIDPELFDTLSFESLNELNPISNSIGYAQLISMLILTFPEIHWVFLPGINLKDEKVVQQFYSFEINKLNEFIKQVININDLSLIPLFDPCNLRSQIRVNIQEKEKGVPIRFCCAAAIDEEVSYALINAYTAFRFGYRAWPISSYYLLKCVFKNDNENKFPCEVSLIFEDLYLNFPDKSEEPHLSNLEQRDNLFQKLKEVEDRILVTVGHKNDIESRKKWRDNQSYLRYSFRGRTKTLFKPFAGIFDLWKNAGKWNRLKNIPKPHEKFNWPPEKNTIYSTAYSTHSTPGKLLLIAEKLIERSQNLLKDAVRVTDAIQAATLALEAKELLACKTPTTALEALSLQHQAEVEAECMFYGVEYDFDVNSRIKDIKREVKAISHWFHSSAKKRSQLNAEISILSALAQKYKKYSQFDEENYCLHECRKLTNSLWVIRNPLKIIFWPVRFYVNYLLQSLTRFVVVILLWIFSFGLIYHGLANKQHNVQVDLIDSFIVSANTFLAFQPPDLNFWVHRTGIIEDFTPVKLIYFILPAVLGFIHLGVFISHLTMILMRKPGG